MLPAPSPLHVNTAIDSPVSIAHTTSSWQGSPGFAVWQPGGKVAEELVVTVVVVVVIAVVFVVDGSGGGDAVG